MEKRPQKQNTIQNTSSRVMAGNQHKRPKGKSTESSVRKKQAVIQNLQAEVKNREQARQQYEIFPAGTTSGKTSRGLHRKGKNRQRSARKRQKLTTVKQ